METFKDFLNEAPRIRIIKARVRGGKVQRRVKVSGVKGYTLRGGKLTRMSSTERMRRKLGARKAKIKRRAKMARSIMKRSRSLRRRQSMGLHETYHTKSRFVWISRDNARNTRITHLMASPYWSRRFRKRVRIGPMTYTRTYNKGKTSYSHRLRKFLGRKQK
jgi:hypothetical protein